MKLNREQIVKALECCTEGDCDGCPRYPFFGCTKANMAVALALIRELTEEKEGLGYLIDELEKEKRDLFEENKKVTEENERLKGALEAEERHYELAMECAKKALAKAKADTVRKMQERLHDCFHPEGEYWGTDIYGEVDQTAKELLDSE